MKAGLQVVWFKRDFRIADHRPLARAAQAGAVLPLYIAEPDLWAQPDASARQWGFAAESLAELQQALAERLAPPLELKYEVVQSDNAKVLRISVSEGEDKPYCLDGSKFYVRNDAETDLAVRDEIVALVLESVNGDGSGSPRSSSSGNGGGGRRPRTAQPQAVAKDAPATPPPSGDPFYLPQMGVELVSSETRSGINYYVVRDMRNGRTVSNVTRRGARKLWNYAIAQAEDQPVDANKVQWKGNAALLRSDKRAGKVRYDLALRENGSVRVFYGVTEDGMEGQWAQFVEEEEAS
jgi:hypothetical protein